MKCTVPRRWTRPPFQPLHDLTLALSSSQFPSVIHLLFTPQGDESDDGDAEESDAEGSDAEDDPDLPGPGNESPCESTVKLEVGYDINPSPGCDMDPSPSKEEMKVSRYKLFSLDDPGSHYS